MCEHDNYLWYLGSAYAENVHLFLNASLREKSKLDNEFVDMLDSALQKYKAAVASFSQKYDEKGGNGG
jgi:flagellar biosynthesis chaperone FliJ